MVTTRRIKNKQQIQYADVKLEEPIPVLLQDFAGKRRVRAVQSHDGHWVGYVDRQASSVADLKVGMTFWNTNKMRPEKINKITETDPIRKRIHLDTDMSKVITSGLDSVYIVV
jgi:hypothetical protein